eukprot:5184734-Amphidinium_carterae.1
MVAVHTSQRTLPMGWPSPTLLTHGILPSRSMHDTKVGHDGLHLWTYMLSLLLLAFDMIGY